MFININGRSHTGRSQTAISIAQNSAFFSTKEKHTLVYSNEMRDLPEGFVVKEPGTINEMLSFISNNQEYKTVIIDNFTSLVYENDVQTVLSYLEFFGNSKVLDQNVIIITHSLIVAAR